MRDLQETRLVTVRRRQRVSVNTLGEKTWAWFAVATIDAAIYPASGQLKMWPAGLAQVVSHELFTDYRVSPEDGGYVVRQKDVVSDEAGRAFLVEFVADEGDKHVYLAAALRQGVVNDLQSLAEQG